MLSAIESDTCATAGMTGRASLSAATLHALRAVPRHEFVHTAQLMAAYENRPLPIGHGQTISQPFIVGLMTDLIELSADDVVLDVGTGCGYQAAVLSRLARWVYSVEIVESLATEARERLRDLGYHNVSVLSGDGAQGWAEHAPYDAILVAAATPRIPAALIEQLKPGGRMILPLGEPSAGQELVLVTKSAAGRVTRRPVLPVAFVPLTGEILAGS